MQDLMLDYFSAEKSEAALFVVAGVTTIAVSIWLWTSGNAYKGMAIPLTAVALIHLSVGLSVYTRTDGQVAALQQQLQTEPAQFQAAETQRMAVVMKNFGYYKALEVFLFALGLALTFMFRDQMFWYAVGAGLILQSSLTLFLDLFAEKRGDIYIEALSKLG